MVDPWTGARAERPCQVVVEACTIVRTNGDRITTFSPGGARAPDARGIGHGACMDLFCSGVVDNVQFPGVTN